MNCNSPSNEPMAESVILCRFKTCKAVTAVRLSPGGHPARKLTSAPCIPLIIFEDSLLVDLQYLQPIQRSVFRGN